MKPTQDQAKDSELSLHARYVHHGVAVPMSTSVVLISCSGMRGLPFQKDTMRRRHAVQPLQDFGH